MTRPIPLLLSALALLVVTATSGCGNQALRIDGGHAPAQLRKAPLCVLPTLVTASVDRSEFQDLTENQACAEITRAVLAGTRGRLVTSAEALPPASGDGTVLVETVVTRYDEGSRIARFMLAGLGQMHLTIQFTFRSATDGAVLARGVMDKWFSLGGMVGGAATMRETMIGQVAEGVAEGLAPTE